jgi:DNA-binding NtrC family response regulator
MRDTPANLSAAPAPSPAPATETGAALDIEAGLPRLLEEAERAWLEHAMKRYPRLRRSELAEKLKISESALYKKLKLYGLTD